MQMSDSEIRWRYKQSKDKDIIKKLAELNDCKPDEIRHIVSVKQTEALKDKPFVRISNKQRHAEYLKLYNQGKSDREIAAEFGRSASTVWAWRMNNSLVSHVPPKRKPAVLNN
jgi:DNA-binding NarL/FixJ family response regulator